ncbi:MAG: hypothetical protein AB8E15_07340 [Bdellovibrionales bacterium]
MDEYQLLVRLDATQGFNNISDVLDIVNEMAGSGISAIAESAPGSPLEGAHVYYIKVRADQIEKAANLLREILSR